MTKTNVDQTNLNFLYIQYSHYLKAGNFKAAKATATSYNKQLKRMGGPKKVSGEFYLSMGRLG